MAPYGNLFPIFLTFCALFFHLEDVVSADTTLTSPCYSDARSLLHVDITSDRSLDQYLGKAVLVVNTASFCTFTHQYPFFNQLQDHFGDQLAILGFPCNQFGLQEPGEGVEIPNTLRYVRPGGGYQPNFYLNEEKIDVNGPNAHPLFVELKKACPPVKSTIGDPKRLYWSPLRVGDITWNFNKFLLDKNLVPYKRYDPSVQPGDLAGDIQRVLSGNHSEDERPQRPQYAREDL